MVGNKQKVTIHFSELNTCSLNITILDGTDLSATLAHSIRIGGYRWIVIEEPRHKSGTGSDYVVVGVVFRIRQHERQRIKQRRVVPEQKKRLSILFTYHINHLVPLYYIFLYCSTLINGASTIMILSSVLSLNRNVIVPKHFDYVA